MFVLGQGFRERRIEWRYFRFDKIQDGGWRPSWIYKNGHNFATGLPIEVLFGSRVGFSGTAELMVQLWNFRNPRWRYTRTAVARNPCVSWAFLYTVCTVINSVCHLHFWVSIANFITNIIPFNTMTHCCCSEHEAQLPLRNRTSALFVANLLFIVVMTNCVTSWTDDIIQTANKLQHAKEQHACRRVTPLSFDFLSRESLGIYAWSLYCQKLDSLTYITVAMVWVNLHLILSIGFRNPTKDVLNERWCMITLPFDAFLLQNQREYPHKLYIARNCSPCRWLVLLIVWLYLH